MRSLLPFALATTACFANGNARSVVVEHAFGPKAEFIYRGALEIMVGPTREVAPSATLSSVTLGSDASRLEVARSHLEVVEAVCQVQDLVARNGLYLIKVSADDVSAHHVVAAVPACHLRLASFREDITLHVDWNGVIIGLDYKAPVGPLASTKDCTKMPVQESSQIVTNIKVVRAASAQSVPLQAVANSPPPGLANLKEIVGNQDPKPVNQSILVKYWYIFIPLLLSWMFSATAPEEGGAGAPAGGAQQAPGSRGAGGGR